MKKILITFCSASFFAVSFFSAGPSVALANPSCVRGDPLLDVWYYSTPLAPGQGGSIMTKIGNGDSSGCHESKFQIHANLPHSWHAVINPHPAVLIPADGLMVANTRKQIDFVVPANTPAGVYPFTVRVKNRQTKKIKTQTIHIQVGNTPVINNILPSSGPVGTHVTITGANFSSLPELAIMHPNGFAYVRNVASNGTSFSFDMPATISAYNCGCSVPAPAGVYNISIANNAVYSNIVNFTLTPY